MAHLVIDIGNEKLKGAFFQNDKAIHYFVFPLTSFSTDLLKAKLQSQKFETSLISSSNSQIEEKVHLLFKEEKWPYHLLKFNDVKIKLEVEEKEFLTLTRIANFYAALFYFPKNDCIVVDIGKTVTFDYISSTGSYFGGAIYPSLDLEKPSDVLGKTKKVQVSSGLYWGLLGAIERITDEMRALAPSPSSVRVIATGEITPAIVDDFSGIIDFIDPHLSLLGIHEILKEINKGETDV